MTEPEYYQMKAYARQDGFFLSLLWMASFTSYIFGLSNQMLAMASMMMTVMSPFFVANRLRKFRDEGRNGTISFGRSYAYTVFVFYYGAIMLALFHYLYFTYLDNGYLVNSFAQIMASDEGRSILEQYGMTKAMDDSLAEWAVTRPIDNALNILIINILLGFVLGVPIGLLMQKKAYKSE